MCVCLCAFAFAWRSRRGGKIRIVTNSHAATNSPNHLTCCTLRLYNPIFSGCSCPCLIFRLGAQNTRPYAFFSPIENKSIERKKQKKEILVVHTNTNTNTNTHSHTLTHTHTYYIIHMYVETYIERHDEVISLHSDNFRNININGIVLSPTSIICMLCVYCIFVHMPLLLQ